MWRVGGMRVCVCDSACVIVRVCDGVCVRVCVCVDLSVLSLY